METSAQIKGKIKTAQLLPESPHCPFTHKKRPVQRDSCVGRASERIVPCATEKMNRISALRTKGRLLEPSLGINGDGVV